MNPLNKRLGREWRTMSTMVRIYCEARHRRSDAALCDDCQEFLDYAEVRLKNAPTAPTSPPAPIARSIVTSRAREPGRG